MLATGAAGNGSSLILSYAALILQEISLFAAVSLIPSLESLRTNFS